jgi:hypothetical protein
MSRYHVNDKDQTRKCRALIKCRFLESHHFDSLGDGNAYVERKLKEEYTRNMFTTLRRENSENPAYYPTVEGSGKWDLIEYEKEESRLFPRIGEQRQITEPIPKNFNKSQEERYIFFSREVKSKTGSPVEHVVLGNPDLILEGVGVNQNALVRGIICRSDETHKSGMRNQYGLRYSLVNATNRGSGEKENILVIETISIPDDQKGKGLASELIEEMMLAYPNAKVPETGSMTKEGQAMFKRLQATRGDKFKGFISRDLIFDPNEEGGANYIEDSRQL